MDTAININDQRTADAFWTLLKPLKREVRQWLAMRLDESLKEQNNPIHTDSLSGKILTHESLYRYQHID